MAEKVLKPTWVRGLLAILAVGFLLNVAFIGWGLPHLYFPDEAFIINRAFRMGSFNFDPEYYGYGVLCPQELCETSLELKDSRSHSTLVCKHSASQDIDHGVNLLLSQKWLVYPDEFAQYESECSSAAELARMAKRVGTTIQPGAILREFLRDTLHGTKVICQETIPRLSGPHIL